MEGVPTAFAVVRAGEGCLYSLHRKYSQEAGSQTKEETVLVAICNSHRLHSVLTAGETRNE